MPEQRCNNEASPIETDRIIACQDLMDVGDHSSGSGFLDSHQSANRISESAAIRSKREKNLIEFMVYLGLGKEFHRWRVSKRNVLVAKRRALSDREICRCAAALDRLFRVGIVQAGDVLKFVGLEAVIE